MLKKEKQRAAVAVAHSKTKSDNATSPRENKVALSKSVDEKLSHRDDPHTSHRRDAKHERLPSTEKHENRHNRIYGN